MLASPNPLATYGRGTTCQSAPARSRWHGHGQGKTATTIVADQGDFVTIITDVPYSVRSKSSVVRSQRCATTKGSREMHRSTLRIPCQSHTDYTTTVQANYGGSKTKDPPERRYPFLSAHTSQIAFGEKSEQEPRPWYTHYRCNYFNNNRDMHSPRSLKLPEFSNKLAMTEGCGIKSVMTAGSTPALPSYWTQYARIHNKLGVMLGRGVARQLPVRRSYNPITGNEQGSAWQEDNQRTSGNRVLYNGYRKDADKHFILG